MNIHPICAAFDLIGKVEYEALRQDIEANGLVNPTIWIYEGMILDGRHRFRICDELGITEQCELKEFKGDDLKAISLVKSLNDFRRHSTPSQRALTGASLSNIARGDVNTQRSLDRVTGLVIPGELNPNPLVSVKEAAKLAGSSVASVTKAKFVIAEGVPELLALVKEGEITLNAAELIAKQDDDAQREMIKEKGWKKVHVAQFTGDNEWYTPKGLIELARAVMGSISVDPASSAAANKIVKAKKFYTHKTDGLDLSNKWHGNVWLNPPYARSLLSKFCDRLLLEVKEGNVEQACILVNNFTETGSGQDLLDACSSAFFIRGRVKYWKDDTDDKNSPLQGQMICYFGPNTDHFKATIKKTQGIGGVVMKPDA